MELIIKAIDVVPVTDQPFYKLAFAGWSTFITAAWPPSAGCPFYLISPPLAWFNCNEFDDEPQK
jgi:hypothetical protein